jgi:hypothetical protein
MRRRRYIAAIVAAGILGSLACSDRGQRPAVAARADTIAVDRDRCLVPSNLSRDPRTAAVRCAELFVIRNGYADLPPVADSSQWIGELVDLGIGGRRNMLVRTPIRACQSAHEFAVLFRYQAAEYASMARVVVMSSRYDDLHLIHQGLWVVPLPRETTGCVDLGHETWRPNA